MFDVEVCYVLLCIVDVVCVLVFIGDFSMG